jgi:hypothetical protein
VAENDEQQLARLLGVAALLRSILSSDAVVVGGVAEMYWTRLPYHPTDLDVCTPLGPDYEQRLVAAGFVRDGRHWWHEQHGVAVEFPESQADGDPARFEEAHGALILGVSDLYMDRLRQSTATDNGNSVEHQSLLAVASSCTDIIDWPYVRRRIAAEPEHLRVTMRRNHRTARRAVRTARLED